MGIREDMPRLVRHEGEWEGTYTYVDIHGKVIDQHHSHLRCSFPSDGDGPYRQINTYTWEDGRQEVHDFPAQYRDHQIWFDTERIDGHAWEVDDRTLILTWSYKHDPEEYLYELIHLDATGNHRARVWEWFHDGACYMRTLINETRVPSN